MAHRKELKTRPYWQVDFKWITGLALVFILTATLFGSVLLRITAEENAVDILTVMMAAMFSPEGLDAPADVQAQAQALNNRRRGIILNRTDGRMEGWKGG